MMDEATKQKLREERAELQAANDAAPGWGAAVGARAERIHSIDRILGEDADGMDSGGAFGRPWLKVE